MSAFIVFFAALLAGVCFVLGTLCKCVSAIIYGALKAIIQAGSVAVLTILGVIVLGLISPIVDSIIKSGFIETIGPIVIMIVLLALVLAIVGGLGSVFVGIAFWVVDLVCRFFGWILMKGMELSEIGYLYSLEIIFDYVNEN